MTTHAPWHQRNSTTAICCVALIALIALLCGMGDGLNVLNGGVR